MQRIVNKIFPDGRTCRAYPFHVSLEGKEDLILCLDEEDYDAMVKIIFVCAKRNNVIVIIYAAVSNHCHSAVLAPSQVEADAYGEDIKKTYSMWSNFKHGTTSLLEGVDTKALLMDSDWYLRNALAYVPRNALDNGCNVNEYRWSGYRAMFCVDNRPLPGWRSVKKLTKREVARIFHTKEDLTDVPWMINEKNELEPVTACDSGYLEQVFNHDQTYFLRTIGGMNSSEIKQKIIDAPRTMHSDTEFHKTVNDISQRWFSKDIRDLPYEKKVRLIPYIFRTQKSTIPQMSRVFGIKRDEMSGILNRKRTDAGHK